MTSGSAMTLAMRTTEFWVLRCVVGFRIPIHPSNALLTSGKETARSVRNSEAPVRICKVNPRIV